MRKNRRSLNLKWKISQSRFKEILERIYKVHDRRIVDWTMRKLDPKEEKGAFCAINCCVNKNQYK